MNEGKTIADLLEMSGYGNYVWSAFGVVLFSLLLLYVSARLRLKKALNIQKELLAHR